MGGSRLAGRAEPSVLIPAGEAVSRIIGIDPGVSGAIVLLEDGQPVEWDLMPALKTGKSSRVNGAALAALCAYDGAHVYVESVHSMPKQGVASSFNFGHSAGVVEGVLQALGKPYSLVTPQAWKKRAGLIGQDKDAARSRAIQLWPWWRSLDAKGAGQAFADAALIALFGGAQ
jgi:crossover junction endodeoxyribonuclease RuvC